MAWSHTWVKLKYETDWVAAVGSYKSIPVKGLAFNTHMTSARRRAAAAAVQSTMTIIRSKSDYVASFLLIPASFASGVSCVVRAQSLEPARNVFTSLPFGAQSDSSDFLFFTRQCSIACWERHILACRTLIRCIHVKSSGKNHFNGHQGVYK